MAVRLNVVMVHAPPPTVRAQRIAEQVVGELIGMPAIDLILVGPLNQIDPASTDFLTLDSLSGDIALLGWQSTEAAMGSLSGLGIQGAQTPHPDDPITDAAQSGPRRLYLFDLNNVTDGQQVCEALQQLLGSRQVRTFSLGGPMPSLGGPNPPRPTGLPAASRLPSQPAANVRVLPEPKSDQIAKTANPAHSSKPTSEANPDNPGRLDLDDLVDQLDLLDP